ncbi:protein BFR2 [Rhodamnia argentea]|uniref:Protein BFR2 n=1 Tax=Rhodamnia argentea TaxID=178133 RepID=A0A8B8MUQ2_9MYRT|nr:protein BFR2 [Rhodamnia argentea]XP_048132167.1 protein BFR2 [Rhodamnia argentea]
MAKRPSSTSDSESDGTQASSGSEPEPTTLPGSTKTAVSTYEKQRMSRIAENNKRMEALGLRNLASSVMGSSRKAKKGDAKGKRKVGEDDDDDRDDDYAPALDDGGGDDDDLSVDDEEDDQDFEVSGSGKRKGKGKVSKPKKKPQTKKLLNKLDYVDDDAELAKAIVLSLNDSTRVSGTVSSGPSKNEPGVDPNGKVEKTWENPRMLKRKKTFTSRVKMTEDELIMHFFQLDEAGKGGITALDLAKVADAHDFMWTDKELADMIHCFDSDGDGKLSLDDFSKIVHRCNMIQGSESS